MFKNKYLKQLRKVQFLIKHYKASIEKLKSPEPESFETKMQLYYALKSMLWGHSLDPGELLELSDASIEHISQLGRYLMNIADYVDTQRVYEKELKRLQKEERSLKDKLGIE